MDSLMTIKEAAQYLKLNYMTLYRLAQRGQVPATKIGGNWRFKKEVIDDWLSRQAKPSEGTVLVVDDDTMVRELLAEVVAGQGYQVVTAEDGENGLQEVERQHFDVIFLDLVLPGVNGAETLRAIKERERGALVVLVTGYGDDPIALQAMSMGPLVMMRKPFRVGDIVEVLNIAARARRWWGWEKGGAGSGREG